MLHAVLRTVLLSHNDPTCVVGQILGYRPTLRYKMQGLLALTGDLEAQAALHSNPRTVIPHSNRPPRFIRECHL